MENQPSDFIKNEVLKIEKRIFATKIICILIGYIGITLWLNAIRSNASLWFVWVLIILQFTLYFSIFITSYYRAKVCGLKSYGAFLFIILCILGRVNDWELIIIPLLIIIMLIISAKNKHLSEKGLLIFNK